ncbi:MAG: type II toxin-antitoxin system RatA family toxin [Magnetospirillum sp.]|nr:type II toxin-antitoxin system RatA family toxin [Magnetospirillum sp.]
MFDLAVDIERYPDFIPWCRRARILTRAEGRLGVDNAYGAGPIEVAFRSQAVFTAPERLEITAADGPFRRFRLLWLFVPLADGGCRVRGDYAVEFRSALLQGVARMGAAEAERRMMATFRNRARRLYGS